MTISPGLFPSVRPPTRRRAAALALACSAGLLTIGAFVGRAMDAGPVTPVVMPIAVEAPKVPAPIVTVNVPPPPAPPAPPPPPPAPEPPPPPPVRAIAPNLDARCIEPMEEGAQPPAACTWDDGFPAISADGTQLVKKHHLGHPSGMSSGLSIVFIDAQTSRTIREVPLLTEVDFDLDQPGKPRPGLAVKLERRVAAAQRTLDAGGFRTLSRLGATHAEPPADARQIRAEIDDGVVRVVDPARSLMLWRHRFSSNVPAPKYNPDTDMCGGKSLVGLTLWWDPATRIVLTEMVFHTGGCMCPSLYEDQVHRLPDAAPVSP